MISGEEGMVSEKVQKMNVICSFKELDSKMSHRARIILLEYTNEKVSFNEKYKHVPMLEEKCEVQQKGVSSVKQGPSGE